MEHNVKLTLTNGEKLHDPMSLLWDKPAKKWILENKSGMGRLGRSIGRWNPIGRKVRMDTFLELVWQTNSFNALRTLLNELDYGLAGAAIVGDVSWWLINLAQMVYLMSGYFPESMDWVFQICVQVSYELPAVDTNGFSWFQRRRKAMLKDKLIYFKLFSVRVSNELGAGHPKAAKFSVVIAVSTSALLGLLFMAIIFGGRTYLPKLFTDEPDVVKETSRLGHLLGATIFYK
ncbi:hypothetical protein HPP92_028660 [Vanilla planifolia]|uniref:Uncharacterized protein n=1 Tax=Vanilla planifolia TaxID=51239 RepID=A0A835P7A3_VANPL|nr:hypothetical protein HPP92_028660 [Vanilla planifolia]